MKRDELALLKEKIIKYAISIGVSKIGFTSAQPIKESIHYLQQREAKAYKFETNKGEVERKINPLLHLAEAQSVIIIALAYGQDFGEEDKKVKPTNLSPEALGHFAKVSWGRDYHRVVMEHLNKLSQYMKELKPETKTLAMVDTGYLLEKPLAVRAGIGWIGGNSLLITPEFGSYVFLGLLLTNLDFPENTPLENSCLKCYLCREKCPTQALEEGNLNLDRCLANLCLYSDLIDEELRVKFENLYGCDICQEVCPQNIKKDINCHPDFRPLQKDIKPSLKEVMNMSNKEFKNRFGHMAGSWRGKKPILRNAILLAGNLKDESSVDNLEKLLCSNPDANLRAQAAWALGKIGTKSSKRVLEKALEGDKQKDQVVKTEIEKALQKN